MATKNQVVDKFLKTNVKIHNSLERLKVLDQERAQIKQEYERLGTITPELSVRMQKNVEDYDNLLKQVKANN